MGRFGRVSVRLAFWALSGAALLFVTGQLLRDDFSELQWVAGRITAGQSFDPSRLARLTPRLLARVPGQCGTFPRSAGVVWMRLEQDAKAAGDTTAEHLRRRKAVAELEGYLSCSPADPYAWLLLYHLKQAEAARPENLRLLELSYRLAPVEGWLMPVRSGLALPLFPALNAEIQGLVLQDIRLMARDRPDAVVAVFSNLEPAQQAMVLPTLRALPEVQRQDLAKRLDALEIDADLNLGKIRNAPPGTTDRSPG